MSCQTPHPHLFLYLDEQLGQREIHEFELHLKTCECCRDALEEWKRQREVLSKFPTPKAPAAMSARILAQVEAYEAEKVGFLESLLPTLKFAAPAMAVFAVCLWGAQTLYTPSQTTRTKVSSAYNARSMLMGDDTRETEDADTQMFFGGE